MEEKISLTIKGWADEDKPREKMLEKGKKALSNAELIAILLRSGLPGKNVVEMAMEVLNAAGQSLATLSAMDFPAFENIKGMGEAKATTIIAAMELGRRMHSEINNNRVTKIGDSNDLFHLFSEHLAGLDHEEFWAVFLDPHNKVLHKQLIASGGQTETTVDPRLIFRSALDYRAVRLMVAHNHPAGSLTPSRTDIQLTKKLDDGGRLLEIKLLDHIIIGLNAKGQTDYYSFHDEGQL